MKKKKKDQNEFAVNSMANVDTDKMTVCLRKWSDRKNYEYKFANDEELNVILKEMILQIYNNYRKIDGSYQVLLFDLGNKPIEYLFVFNKAHITHIIELPEHSNLVDSIMK